MRFSNHQEHERYMDSLERQMEQKRQEIGRSLDEIQGSGRRTVPKRLRSYLPSFLNRTSVRDEEGERKAAIKRSDSEASRSWWQIWR